MEESSKENMSSSLTSQLFSKLMNNQAELTSYLQYIRKRPPAQPFPNHVPKSITLTRKQISKERKGANIVKPYVEEYYRLVKEAVGLENQSGRKIIGKLIQYLQEFPSMGFMIQKINSFGKESKKLNLNQNSIIGHSTDDMVPLFRKVIEKVQMLKKEAQSKKLMQLGQRISHLQLLVGNSKRGQISQDNPLHVNEPQRVDKYLIMEENISKAQKNYGKFSPSFQKNQQVFSNINKVIQQISQSAAAHNF